MASQSSLFNLPTLPGVRPKKHRRNPPRRIGYQGQTISLGRTNPVTPLSHIVQTVQYGNRRTDVDQYATTLPRQELYAPAIGGKECYIPKRGEIALELIRSFEDRVCRASNAVAPDVEPFTSVNGLQRSERVKVAGVVTNAQNGMDSGRDTVGVLVRFGTVTTINSGSEQITAGSQIYVDPNPYTIEDASTHSEIPGVKLAGEPPEKFVPATCVLHDYTIQAFAERVKKELRMLHKENTDTWIEDAKTLIQSELDLYSKDMPMRWFADIRAGVIHADWAVNSGEASVAQKCDALNFLLEQIQTFYEKQYKQMSKYNEALGVVAMFGQKHRSLDIGPLTTEQLRNDDGTLLLHRATQYLLWASDAEQLAINETHGWVKKWMLGTALNTSQPGQMLDVALNLTH